MTETRIRLLAFLCTLASFFALGILLFLDYRRVEQRDATLAASTADPASTRGDASLPAAAAQRPASGPPEGQAGSQRRMDAQVEQRNDPEPPSRLAGTASQTLNDVLKAASNGDWARADRLLMDGSASAGSGGKAATSELTEQGKKAIAAGDYGKAIEILGAAIAADPQDADALNHLAFALLREGKLEEAHAHVRRSLALSPAHAATWANAAEILAERDNALASRAALRVAIHLATDRDRTRRFLTQADRTVSSAKFRAVIAEVLPQFDDIPRAGRGAS
jgi:Flp pilus assembly protein TadD